ncbi:MAG: patatin-like phospholipase family protein, partial [Silvibacterium sp.]
RRGRTMKIRAVQSWLLPCILLVAYSHPQEVSKSDTSGRPKLGLVLEGGGALGLAHIGVIQWMEEHRIPISYIAGTSMGGLVGGIYSTGRSPAEVREIVSGINWDQVLSGQTPFQDLSFRRKQDAHEVPGSIEFGLRKGLQFPGGFNTGQQVSLILDRIALPYSELKSFNDLPIPFACVATDLVSGKPHVFRSGPLALALRSTMSLPGIFTPVRTGDHIYADGGLLNNIPIDVAKEMGADIVIGIHLETAPLSPTATLSSFAVLGQSISVMIAANELRSMEQADLLVTVPLQKYNALDYGAADAIIKAGYDAAASKARVLSAFSVSEAEWQQYLADRKAREKTTPIPEFVQVAGAAPELADSIEKKMSIDVGKPVDSAKLDQQVMTLSGQGRFSNVGYSMIEQQGKQGLQIQTEQKPYAPPLVRPLILIDGSDYNNVLFSIGARITFLDFGSYRSELRNDVIVGSQYLADSEYYHPFTPTSNWFVAPRAGVNSVQENLYNENTLIASYRNREALGGLDVGYGFGNSGEFRFGYEGGYQHLSPEIGNSTVLPTVSGATGDVRLQYQLNTLDDQVIPRSGESLLMYAKGFNVNPAAPGPFPLSEIQSQSFFRLSEPSSVFFSASGGSSYGYKTGIPSFSLGGSQRLVAWGENELLTDQYFVGQLGYIRELLKLPPLLGSNVEFIGLYEAGKTYKLPLGPSPPNLPMDGAAGIIVNTIFGPVEVAGAVGDYGRARFFFRIGRIF